MGARHVVASILALVLCMTPYLTDPLLAQDDLHYGLVAEYGYGPLRLSRDSGVVNPYNGTLSGRSSNHTGSIGAFAVSPALLTDRLGASLSVSIRYSTGRFESDPFIADSVLDATQLQRVPVLHAIDVDATSLALRLDLRLTATDGNHLTFGLGPWLAFDLLPTARAVERIVSPDSIRFDNGETTQTISDGPTLRESLIDYGLRLTAGYEMTLGGSIHIMPMLHIDGNAQAFVRGPGWNVFSGGIGIALRLGSREQPPVAAEDPPPAIPSPTIPPAPIDEPQRAKPRLTASIDLIARDTSGGISDGVTIDVHRALHVRRMPIVPAILFDSGSSRLDARQHLVSSLDRFALADLSRAGWSEIYRHTLNVIGERLRERPSAKITLAGTALPDEPAQLAGERAEAVRSYLKDVWKIDRGRIRVTSHTMRGSEERARYRGVTIGSSDAALLAPIEIEWVEQRLLASPVEAAQQIVADGGLMRWTATITQNGRVANRQAGTSLADSQMIALTLVADPSAPNQKLPPLIAELRVEDSTGGIVTARDSLPLSWSPGTKRGSSDGDLDATVMRTLILEPWEAMASMPKWNEMVRGLKLSIPKGASVAITDLGPENGKSPLATRLRDELAAGGIPPGSIRLVESGSTHPPDDIRALPSAILRTAIVVTVEL